MFTLGQTLNNFLNALLFWCSDSQEQTKTMLIDVTTVRKAEASLLH